MEQNMKISWSVLADRFQELKKEQVKLQNEKDHLEDQLRRVTDKLEKVNKEKADIYNKR
jgi:predicted nuclease with TOPRIM domain